MKYDVKAKKQPADMRGQKIEIEDGALDMQGNVLPSGEAHLYKGSTGALPKDYVAVVLGSDFSTFHQVDKRYIKGL
jgi:hypothetical protein